MYFNKLGTTEYNNITIPDILKRVTLTGDISVSNLAEQYTIIEGETPESLSFNYYGAVDYYWVILLCNNIKSRYFDWPMSSNELGQYIEQLYGNKSALFFSENQLDGFFVLCDAKYVRTTTNKEYSVLECDRNLNKLVIEKISSSDILEGNHITLLNDEKEIICGLQTSRVVYENEYAVHHLVDGEENPREYLNSYVAGQGEEYIVSNTQHELEQNENKRIIFLIKPEYVSTFVNTFKSQAKSE